VSEAWFDQDAHTSVELFVCTVPLAYFRFDPHDRYANSTRYEMATLFRLFVLKELHGWDHETALVEYLNRRSDIRKQLGIESIPDQSTLWRSWHTRFTNELCETIKTVAQTILISAQNARITVPREPDRTVRHHDTESGQPNPDNGTVLDQASEITDHVSRIIFPTFSLNRREGCEIPENAYWDLQTYLGL
jgi:hypothetical protein